MSKENDDVMGSLAARLRGTGAGGGTMQVMRDVPPPSSKSLADLMQEEGNSDASLAQKPRPAVAASASVSDPSEDQHTKVVIPIKLHLIVESPYQPRLRITEEEIESLSILLKDRGQDEPIRVRLLANGKYELIAGHRRTRAARLLGWAELDGIVIVADDREAERLTLTANTGREDESDFERAVAYDRAKQGGFAETQEEIAAMFGVSQGRVSQCLSLLKMPDLITSLLQKYPKLFGYSFYTTITELTEAYPAGVDTIRKALEGLIDNSKLTPGDVRNLVQKELRVKQRKPKQERPVEIQRPDGTRIYSIKAIKEKEQIVIDLDPDADFDYAAQRVTALLRDLGRAAKKKEKEKS